MTIPGFTAEASLGTPKEDYALTTAATRKTGMVLPQGYVHTPGGDTYYCYNEGGYSGCFKINRGTSTLY